MKSHHLAIAAAVAFFVLVPGVEAQRRLFPFAASQPAAGPPTTDLTENAGPWLVMCASFVGESAYADAERLAAELQQQGFRTYTFRQEFDYSQPVPGLFSSEVPDVDANGNVIPRQQTMKVARGDHSEEIAVLVGDFATVDDHRAQEALKTIKTMRIQSLGGMAREELSGEVTTDMTRTHTSAGQLAGAFLIINPTLPEEYFATQPIEQDLLNLNRQFAHSLLNCPGPYSVRVATFRGDNTFETSRINEVEQQQRGGLFRQAKSSKLAEAGLKASVLCKKLREKGVDAYEFHDRFESYVCVGSFSYVTRENADGSVESNPAMVKTVEEFQGTMTNAFGQGMVRQAKSMDGLKSYDIAFDVQPIPVLVPKTGPDHRSANNR